MKKLFVIGLCLTLLLVSSFMIKNVLGAVIFYDGFEDGDLNAWTSSLGDITVQSTVKYEGSYSAKFDGYSALMKTINPVYEEIASVHFCYFENISIPNYNQKIMISSFQGSESVLQRLYVQNVSGVYEWYVVLYNNYGFYWESNSTSTVETNFWYNITEYLTVDSSATYQCYINGTLVFSESGFDNSENGYVSAYYLYQQMTPSASMIRYEDEVKIAESLSELIGEFILECDGFTATQAGWIEVGSTPYLDIQDYPTNYIKNVGDMAQHWEGRFTFENTEITTFSNQRVHIYLKVNVGYVVDIWVWNGTTYSLGGDTDYRLANDVTTNGVWTTKSYDISTWAFNLTNLNAFALYFFEDASGGEGMYIDECHITFDATVEEEEEEEEEENAVITITEELLGHIPLYLGLVGLILLMLSLYIFFNQMGGSIYGLREGFIWGFLFFMVGLGLFLGWLFA